LSAAGLEAVQNPAAQGVFLSYPGSPVQE